MNTIHSTDFRLAEVLDQHKQKHGSFAGLARAIRGATPRIRQNDPDPVDRRKLKSLVEVDPRVVISLEELRALDRYLEQYGEGLAYVPLFRKPDIMRSLADSGHVTFLLGAKQDPERRWLFAHWDVLGMAEMQRGIGASGVSVRFDIRDVSVPQGSQGGTPAIGAVEDQEWIRLLDDPGPSLVCLGSSRTIPAAESMLSRMFVCPSFRDAPPDARPDLPFHFVWNERLPWVFPSHLRLPSSAIEGRAPDAARLIAQGKGSAIVVGDSVLLDRVTPRGWGETFGVVAVQRRRHGAVWVVLAGVTGAATFVGAKLARRLATRLHEEKPGQDSSVYWGVVRARVEEDAERPVGSLREFAEEKIVFGPSEWSPPAD